MSMAWSKDLKFPPWVGSHYDKGLRGQKVLIVGESCYSWSKDGEMHSPAPDHATQLVEERRDPKLLDGHELRFMKNIEQTFAWIEPHGKSAIDFWDRVAFYEFVQTPMESRDHRPKAEDWRSSWPPFVEVVQALQPECVFIFGFVMWNNLAPEDIGPAIISEGVPELHASGYTASDNFRWPAFRMHHPSRAYRPSIWATLAEIAMETAGGDWQKIITLRGRNRSS